VRFILSSILVLLATSVFGQGPGSCDDTITISSLPYTTVADDTCYCLSGNLTTATNGIYINHSNVSIFGEGDTITFNTGSANSNYGVYFDSFEDSILLESLTVIQTASSPGDSCRAILAGNVNKIEISDCNAHVYGYNGMCVAHGLASAFTETNLRGVYNFFINDGNYTHFGDGFSTRSHNPSEALKLNMSKRDTILGEGDYHYRVSGITIDSCPHNGILANGKIFIDSNHIWLNAHNTDPVHAAENCYGIGMGAAGSDTIGGVIVGDTASAGSRISYNTIGVRDSYQGGRGIYVGRVRGTSDNRIQVKHNTLTVSEGPDADGDDADGNCFGIRVRWEDEYVDIDSNTITMACDDSSTTSHVGGDGIGIFISAELEMQSAVDTAYGNIRIYNNTVTNTYSADVITSGMGVYGLAFEIDSLGHFQVSGIDTGRNGTVANTVQSYNNNITSNVTALVFGQLNAGCVDALSTGDTLNWADTQYGSGVVAVGFGADKSFIRNILRDPIYVNTSSADIYSGSGSGIREVFSQRSVSILVATLGGSPINNATYYVWNTYDDTVLTGSTGSDGLITGNVNYDYDLWTGASTHTDSTYNNIVIKAISGGIEDSVVLTFTDGLAIEGSAVEDTILLNVGNMSITGANLKGVTIQ